MVLPERAGVFSFAAQPKRFWRSARTLSSEKTHPIGRQVLQPLKNTLSGPDSQRIPMVGGDAKGNSAAAAASGSVCRSYLAYAARFAYIDLQHFVILQIREAAMAKEKTQ
jgi:hypothetical protein